MPGAALRTTAVITFLAPILLAACSAGLPLHRQYTRSDEKVLGFTRHFSGSLFSPTRERIFSIEVLMPREGLSTGDNHLEVIVHDARDTDVEGAVLSLTTIPEGRIAGVVVKEKGDGLYAAGPVRIVSAGSLDLVVTVRKGTVTDLAVFPTLTVTAR